MKLIFKFILLVLCFSFSFSQHNHAGKCSIINNNLRSRPDTDASTPSPTGHFLIHYDLNGEDAPSQIDLNNNNIPDYIDEVGIIADSTRNILVDIMGFLPEIEDSDGLYDIYIQDRVSGYYGVNYPDSNSSEGSSYIIIDNAYEPGEFLTSGINTMRLTVAHEFFHAIQRSYRTVPNSDTYFWEMSSTWIEDVIVPDGNDYIYWVDPLFNNPDQRISDTDGYSIALFGHYLSIIIDGHNNQFDSNIIKKMWEVYSDIGSPIHSMNSVLSSEYETDFSNAWLNFLSRNHFNGIYNNDDNAFYYYSDQQYLSPISSSVNFLNENIFFDLFVSEESAAFKTLYLINGGYISLSNSVIPSASEINGSIAVISSNNPGSNRLIDVNEDVQYIDSESYLHFSYSGYENSIIDIEVDCNSDIMIIDGDLNFDELVNVQDIIVMIEFIFNNLFFNEIQFESGDLNLDGECNIFDIIMIIDIILD